MLNTIHAAVLKPELGKHHYYPLPTFLRQLAKDLCHTTGWNPSAESKERRKEKEYKIRQKDKTRILGSLN